MNNHNNQETQPQTILVIDYGSQYTQIILRRLRESYIHSEIAYPSITLNEIVRKNYLGVILSGGPNSVDDKGAPQIPHGLLQSGIPILGICYGLQLIVHNEGGRVASGGKHEYGDATLIVPPSSPHTQAHPLLQGIPHESRVWMSHEDEAHTLPPHYRAIASTDNTTNAAIEHVSKPIYGIQFHCEVAHTEYGTLLLENFAKNICNAPQTWTPSNFVDTSVKQIRLDANGKKVLCGVSGGVDSTVAAALVHKAIGNNLTCMFIDNGLLREDEVSNVQAMFRDVLKLELHTIHAKDRFLNALAGITSPEEKRKIIGEMFIRVFEENARKLGEFHYLVQGTLYSDVIESLASKEGVSQTIKSHHNVGGLPENMQFELIEPLRHLFKDEVRLLGKELAIPHDTLWRHPFPGPGLAVRILGAVDDESCRILRQVDKIFTEELHNANLYNQIWQALAVLLPVYTVGVMGDQRTYERVAVLRAVESTDAMTATWFHMPHKTLETLSNRIVNEVRGVNRVVYDISSKPPSTIEWE